MGTIDDRPRSSVVRGIRFSCLRLERFVGVRESLIPKPYRNRRTINTIVARTLFHAASVIAATVLCFSSR